MKKFVVILLLILPIFLMVTISLVGQMLATITYINVESVMFVDELENEISLIKLGKGETKKLSVQVLPSLANNKRVEFSSLDENIVSVDSTGNISGIDYGYAIVLVETLDGKKTDRITVNVSDDIVTGVNIELTEKTLYLHEEFTLIHSVLPQSAIDKKVTWTSSHPEYVEVNALGVIKALKITEEGMSITITATTNDGGFTDTCEVVVLPYLIAFKAKEEGNNSATFNTLTIDLMSQVYYNSQKFSPDDIEFSIDRGQEYADIVGNTLTFNEEFEGEPIRLVCKASNGTESIEIKMYIRYLKN
jgi:uncharacterized protein YjdB